MARSMLQPLLASLKKVAHRFATFELRCYFPVVAVWALAGACGPPRTVFPSPPPSLQTVNGMVIVDQCAVAQHMAQGLRVRVQLASRRPAAVDLAPGWHLDQQGLHLDEHDRPTVEGCVAIGDGMLRGRRVTNGRVTVQLRDDEQGRRY
jgi:hypothetical protein